MATATHHHGLKSVQLSAGIEAEPQLQALIEDATLVLADVIGQSAGLVDASWELVIDELGRRLVGLKIRDRTNAAAGRFRVEDLHPGPYLRSRFHQMWGGLLRAQSTALLKQFEMSGAAEDQ